MSVTEPAIFAALSACAFVCGDSSYLQIQPFALSLPHPVRIAVIDSMIY
ncbi:hypothetical protein [Stutzerimonas zhaodongensis]|nr:hypothetical protein [Stutzerimonas zhaodongensis]MCQ2029007.1 hypothetical protein [Stutzerimonas zhaodongensis]